MMKECMYEKCHRKMKSKLSLAKHHLKCKKRTDSPEDERIYEYAKEYVRREKVGRVERKLAHAPIRPNVDDAAFVRSQTKRDVSRWVETGEMNSTDCFEKQMVIWNGWEILAEDTEQNCLIVKVPLGK